MHYFLDGYNVIRSTDWLAAGPLRDQRDRLLRFIETKRPQGSPSNRVTVVFDGRVDVSSPRHAGETEVLFSQGPDADALIKRRVDELSNPREAVVVTDDQAIRKWVRGVGARVMSCGDFLRAGAEPRRRGGPVGVDPETAREINEDLPDSWKAE